MKCQRCERERILEINAKCSDLCQSEFKGCSKDGYPPKIEGISKSDYISISVCLECGQVQGKFPKSNPEFYEEWFEENLDNYFLCEECQISYPLVELENGLCQKCR